MKGDLLHPYCFGDLVIPPNNEGTDGAYMYFAKILN